MGKLKKAVQVAKAAHEVWNALSNEAGKKLAKKAVKKRGLRNIHHQKDEQHFQPGENPGYLGGGDCGSDIAMRAADNLIRKWNADKDAVIINVAEVLNNRYEQETCESVKTLRAHMDGNIVITDTWDRAENPRELEESELQDGEISARTFTVGCFLIRQAACLYQGSDCIYQEAGRIPAERGIVSEYKKQYPDGRVSIAAHVGGAIFSLPELSGEYRKASEISAKYIGKSGIPSNEWQHICYEDAHRFGYWYETIKFICAVKSGASVPDSQASLFVRKEYVGSSFSVDHWYRLAPGGTVKEYRLHQLDETCRDKLWEL